MVDNKNESIPGIELLYIVTIVVTMELSDINTDTRRSQLACVGFQKKDHEL